MPSGLILGACAVALAASSGLDEDAARAAFERGQKLFREAAELKAGSTIAGGEAARRYREAAMAFVEAWKAGAATTEVFTNAANAFAFAGAPGEAVLFYKRALSVDPGNTRARDALDHLRQGLPIKKPVSGAGSSIRSSLFFWHDGLSFRTRRTLFLVLFPAAFLAFSAALVRRKPFAFIGCCLLVPALVLLGSVLLTALTDESRAEAVILVEAEGRLGQSDVLYSPSHSRPFPPGTEVVILGEPRPAEGAGARSGDWVNVRLLDGKESWVPARTVEKVLP